MHVFACLCLSLGCCFFFLGMRADTDNQYRPHRSVWWIALDVQRSSTLQTNSIVCINLPALPNRRGGQGSSLYSPSICFPSLSTHGHFQRMRCCLQGDTMGTLIFSIVGRGTCDQKTWRTVLNQHGLLSSLPPSAPPVIHYAVVALKAHTWTNVYYCQKGNTVRADENMRTIWQWDRLYDKIEMCEIKSLHFFWDQQCGFNLTVTSNLQVHKLLPHGHRQAFITRIPLVLWRYLTGH